AAARPHAGDQRVQRALTSLVAGLFRAPHDLERAQVGLLEQQIEHERFEGLRLGRAAHAALGWLRRRRLHLLFHARCTTETHLGCAGAARFSRIRLRRAYPWGLTRGFGGGDSPPQYLRT